MPFYSYLCGDCGPFDDMRPLAAYAEPAACPACGKAAPRELGAPAIRSAGGEAPAATRPLLRHRTGCGCCSPGMRRASSAEAVAAGAPRRGQNAAAGSFLSRA